MRRNQAPQPKNYETLPYELAQAAALRPQNCTRSFNPGIKKPAFQDTVAREPLVAEDHFSGNQQLGLTHLITVGNSMLAISRAFNRPRAGDAFGRVESVRVSVLPMGVAENSIQTSRTLFQVQTSTLRNARENGVVQPWESVTIGRSDLTEVTGVEDMAVSRQHLGMTVTSDGTVNIADLGSKFGTQILTMDDFSMNGLDDQGQNLLEDTRQMLQQKPYMWNNQYADNPARIVDPY